MKEKLELKHLAPYLPYGVQVKFNISGNIDVLEYINTKKRFVGTVEGDSQTDEYYLCDYIDNIKPILRSLADLNKPEYEADRDELSEMDMECIDHNHIFYSFNNESTLVEHVSFDKVQYLISKHYDIFNLIPSGLAIDINTIK